MPDYPPTGLDDTLRFGQYEDEKLWWVIENDPEYIRWLIEDADMDFELSNAAYEHYEKHLNR